MKKIDLQVEFVKFPERTPLRKKAMEYINHKEEIKRMTEEVEKIKVELIEEFKKSGMEKIRVEGKTIVYSHTEKDKVVVKSQPGEI